MIVNSNETKAVLTGNMEVTRGSISLNKETFGLIIKGIYEDKVLASCREPIFNAVDSHVESGRGDVPIIIHSPTELTIFIQHSTHSGRCLKHFQYLWGFAPFLK